MENMSVLMGGNKSRERKEHFERRFVYSREQENKIIAALVSSDVQHAVIDISKVLDANFLERTLSPEMSRCLIYSLLGTLLRAEEEAEWPAAERTGCIGREQENENRCVDELSLLMHRSQPLDELPLKELHDRFAEMAQEVVKPRLAEKENRNQHLSREVMTYILENYSDPNLNITQIGRYFQLSPNYLSMLFRTETGMNLLEIIGRIRVQKAEKLLQEGVVVAEVGKEVGIADVTTFIRTFKRYTGVTPGQVRTKNCKK